LSRLSALWLDVSPLRSSRDYRRLWTGDLLSSAGQQFTIVALPYQVFTLTHSSFDVGLLGAVQLVPVLVGALTAGTLADAFDRRRLLAAAQLGLETYVVVLLAVIVLATIGLVTALALGQGLALLSGNIAAGRYVQDGTAVGDVISVDGVEGTVEEFGYASVTVRSEDGHLYRIPNRTLLEKIVRKRG
jgi:small-conductance mechanosensitive channel